MDALLSAAGVAGGARQVEKVEALELNKLSVEQVKERQARLSRMRALLFYHDERAKRLKAIKSKSYRKHEAARLKMLAKKKGLTATARGTSAPPRPRPIATLARCSRRRGRLRGPPPPPIARPRRTPKPSRPSSARRTSSARRSA